MALFLRIALIGALCAGAVYVTASAFVPSMSSPGGESLFIIFALLGLALGIVSRKDR